MEAIWDDAGREHIARHGVTPDEVDDVLAHARPPFPEEIGNDKNLVLGQTQAGRFLQVIFVYRPIDTFDWQTVDWDDLVELLEADADEVVYVIHARELNDREKRGLRKRLR
jgi:uncharacterized DUF497 family protein